MKKLLVGLILILIIIIPSTYAQDEQTKNVLVLNAYHKGFPWTDNLVSGIESGLEPEENNIELIVEYMDTKTMGYGAEYKQRLYELYSYKYRDQDFDLIISSDDNAFNFLREYHEELFPGVPVVFSGVNNLDAPNIIDPSEFTGILETTPHEETMDLILKLHPKTKKIILVVDKTPSGEYRWSMTEPSLSSYENIEFIRLSDDYYASEIEDMLEGLAEDTVVIFFTLYRDKSGEYLSLKDGASLVSKASTRPVYITHQQVLPYGVVGGKLLGGFYHGENAAEIAKRVLDGEEMSSISVVEISPTQYMFDYVQLEKWGIKLSDLPEDSIIVNEPYSLYKENIILIWGVIVTIIALAAIVITLQVNIIKRKKAEEALRESEERYALAQRAANIGSWDWDIRTGEIYWSESIESLFGFGRGEFGETYEAFLECVHSEDRQYVIDSVNACREDGKEYNIEHRIVWPDGTVRSVSEMGGVFRDENGKAIRMLGMVVDITERKRTEEALRKAHEELEAKVEERTKELREKTEKLERMNKLFIDRELKMKELKEEIEKMKKKM